MANTQALMQGRCRIEFILGIVRGWLRELRDRRRRRGVYERGPGTYASRVQQVSPSASPPGALSVLTDSFSLAGMLTARQREQQRQRKKKDSGRKKEIRKEERHELTGHRSLVILLYTYLEAAKCIQSLRSCIKYWTLQCLPKLMTEYIYWLWIKGPLRWPWGWMSTSKQRDWLTPGELILEKTPF